MAVHGIHRRPLTKTVVNSRAFNGDPGKFGRMFPELTPLFVKEKALVALANAMRDTRSENDKNANNPNIPAGFTYLGQFVDHDITLDTTPLAQQKSDPTATVNFRSPALDLDSLYGDGPKVHPHLYARDPRRGFALGPELLVGRTSASPDQAGNMIGAHPNDLPRNQVGRAIIADERNDENLLVAQTHLAFIKFHNAVVADLRRRKPGLDDDALFSEARRIVTWHYQWIVLFEFVEKLTEPGLVLRIKERGRKFYRFASTPYMPVEFAVAAYRLGHSMVRGAYDHNRVFNGGQGALANGTLELLFLFTGKSGRIVGELAQSNEPPNPIPSLPSNWIIDWRRFFDFSQSKKDTLPSVNPSRRLDPFIVPALHRLPDEKIKIDETQAEGPVSKERILPFRNLKRGVQVGLPSGQDVARFMRSVAPELGVDVLGPDEIAKGTDGDVAREHKLLEATPLWYYILKEAQLRGHDGMHLGPVGSLIVAETFLGLVHGDPQSFLARKGNWTPELPSAQPGHFTMADLLTFTNDLNPIGD